VQRVVTKALRAAGIPNSEIYKSVMKALRRTRASARLVAARTITGQQTLRSLARRVSSRTPSYLQAVAVVLDQPPRPRLDRGSRQGTTMAKRQRRSDWVESLKQSFHRFWNE
jgi:hypothetical protein